MSFEPPIIIGICGGTSCGKTSVANNIKKKLRSLYSSRYGVGTINIDILSQDNSYKTLNQHEKEQALISNYNFDHPSAQDHELFYKWLSEIKKGNVVHIPVYDFVTHSHSDTNIITFNEHETPPSKCDVLIVEGLMLFYHEEIRGLLDLKIFVDVDDDERLARRIERDVKHRGRNTQTVLKEWRNFAQPGFKQFILPTKEHADVIVPRGADNNVAIDMIVTHILEM